MIFQPLLVTGMLGDSHWETKLVVALLGCSWRWFARNYDRREPERPDSENFYYTEDISVLFLTLLATECLSGATFVLADRVIHCFRSDLLSCQTRTVSPVDGSVFLHNFGSALTLETRHKWDWAISLFFFSCGFFVQKAVIGIGCYLTCWVWR